MGWTKRAIVEEAYGELALAGYVFDLDPEEEQAAKRRLDTMMATWGGQDINLGYAQSLTPDGGDLDDESGIPVFAIEAVYLQLALRIAASKGKQLPQSTKANAKAAYDAMLARLAGQQLQQQQYRSQIPYGAGNKPWRYAQQPFLPQPDTAPLGVSASGELEFRGD